MCYYIITLSSSNSEADASELLEDNVEIFPLCYMDSDVIGRLNLKPHTGVLPVAKRLVSWEELNTTRSSNFPYTSRGR